MLLHVHGLGTRRAGGRHPLGDLVLHNGAFLAVALAREAADRLHAALVLLEFGRRQRVHGERLARDALDHQAHVRVVFGQAEDVFGQNHLLELQAERLGVVGAHLEHAHTAHVAEHGIPERGVLVVDEELVHVLMRHRQVQAVLARLGEDRSEGLGGEVLELIDVQVEVAALFLGDVRAAHGVQLELGHEHGTEERRVVLAELSLAQVHQDDLAAVHRMADIHFAVHLAHDIADERGREQLADLVLDGSYGLRAVFLGPAGEFVLPEAAHEVVLHVLHHFAAEVVVGEDPQDAEHRVALHFDEREQRIAQDVLHASAPHVGPEFLEDAHHAGRDERLLFLVRACKHVEGHREFLVGRIEEDNVVGTLGRDEPQTCLDEVTVRINNRKAFARVDIREDHVLEQRRFTHAGLSDHIGVTATVVGADAELCPLAAENRIPEHGDLFFDRGLRIDDREIDGRLQFAARHPIDVGGFDEDVRDMPERRDLFRRENVRNRRERVWQRRGGAGMLGVETVALRQRKLAETARDLLGFVLGIFFLRSRSEDAYADVHQEQQAVDLVDGAGHVIFTFVAAHAGLLLLLEFRLRLLSGQQRDAGLGVHEPRAEASQDHIQWKEERAPPPPGQVDLGEELGVGRPVFGDALGEQRQERKRAAAVLVPDGNERHLYVPAHAGLGIADERGGDAGDGVDGLATRDVDVLGIALDGEHLRLRERQFLRHDDLAFPREKRIVLLDLNLGVRVLGVELAFHQRAGLARRPGKKADFALGEADFQTDTSRCAAQRVQRR